MKPTIDLNDITVQSQSQVDYEVMRLIEAGRDYLVVPVVMMVEGVHSGSGGPILHLQENFSRNPQDWNGVPLTAGHPVNGEGEFVSVNSVAREQWVVGYLRNARVENGRLKADAWIDTQRAIAVNPEVVNYITEGRQLEVSTGAITQDIPQSGEHNGEPYRAVTMSYMPDHLALLPGERGACSWQDGCGIRNNQQTKEEGDEMKLTKEQLQAMKASNDVANHLQDNAAGFMERSNMLQSQLDRLDSESRIHFLKEVYEDVFVYAVRDRDRGDTRFYKQAYTMQDNKVEWSGDAQEVRMNVEFVPLQQNNQEDEQDCGCSMRRTRYNNNNQTKEDSNMSDKNVQPSGEVMDMVSALITNERTQFNKADRAWLLQLNEDQLGKLEPVAMPAAEPTREEALQALAADLSDVEKLKGIIPDAVKQRLDIGLKAYEDTRKALIDAIQANTSKEDWPDEQLQAMETDVLQRLEKSVRKTDYSGNGPVTVHTNANNGVEPLLPAGMQFESKN